MDEADLLRRITVNPKVLAGKPVIRGTRLSVEFILNLMAHGETIQDVLSEYEGLSERDVYACLFFARKSLESTSFVPIVAESA